MKKQPPSALDAAVKAAVREALDEHLVPLLNEHLLPRILSRPKMPQVPLPFGERFVSMAELCRRLGLNRTTILRRERAHTFPRRQTFPDGRRGWTGAQVDEWFASAEVLEPDHQKNLALAARLERAPGGLTREDER